MKKLNFNFKILIVLIFINFNLVSNEDNEDTHLITADEDDFNQVNDLEQNEHIIECSVPKFAPYLTVLRTSSSEIEFNVTDINEPNQVDGYTIYYWGFRIGPKSSYKLEDRHFGHKNFTKDGPFVLTKLKAKFSYCADLTSFNKCNHGPFCMACFENVITF